MYGQTSRQLRTPNRIPTPLAVAAAACVLLGTSAFSGCSPKGTHDAAPGTSATVPASPGSAGIVDAQESGGAGGSPGAPSSPADSPSPAGPAVLPDGRSASYLKSVNVQGKTATFDLIQLLEGDAAMTAWAKTHPDEPDGPPEGYILTNDNTKLRTITLAANVTVKVINLNSSDPSVTRSIKLSDLPKHLSGEKNTPLPYWLTVKHGQVTLIEEEYLA